MRLDDLRIAFGCPEPQIDQVIAKFLARLLRTFDVIDVAASRKQHDEQPRAHPSVVRKSIKSKEEQIAT